MTHAHRFILLDRATAKYRCACGVYGRWLGRKLVPFVCQQVVTADRKHCGADAVEVSTINRNTGRCVEHARQHNVFGTEQQQET